MISNGEKFIDGTSIKTTCEDVDYPLYIRVDTSVIPGGPCPPATLVRNSDARTGRSVLHCGAHLGLRAGGLRMAATAPRRRYRHTYPAGRLYCQSQPGSYPRHAGVLEAGRGMV